MSADEAESGDESGKGKDMEPTFFGLLCSELVLVAFLDLLDLSPYPGPS